MKAQIVTVSDKLTAQPDESPIAEDANKVDLLVKRLLWQAFEGWITPEVERRRTTGALPLPFQLFAAQRIQRPNGSVVIRLNEEVRGIATIPTPRFEIGQGVFGSHIHDLSGFDLEDEDLDSGHWTVLWTGKNWFTSFNFLTQRGKCLDLLSKASEFLEAVTLAHKRGHAAVTVDTLFSACELIAKAQLVSSHYLDLDSKTHAPIASRINQWRKHGNADGAFVDLYNLLGRLRPRYRYDATFSTEMPVSGDDLSLVSQMIEVQSRRLAPPSSSSS